MDRAAAATATSAISEMLENEEEEETTSNLDLVQQRMSGYDLDPDLTREPILLAVQMTLGCSGIIGNLAVLVVIATSQGMRAKTANVFVANQSALDCLCGLLLVAGVLSSPTSPAPGGMWGEVMCRLWLTKAPLWGLFISSTYNLVAFSLERYLQIVWPIVHRLTLTSRRLAVVIIVVWLIGPSFVLAVQVPTSKMQEGSCRPLSHWASDGARAVHGVITIVVIYLVPVGTFVFCYTKIFFELRRTPPSNNHSGSGSSHFCRPATVPSSTSGPMATASTVTSSKSLLTTESVIGHTIYTAKVSSAASTDDEGGRGGDKSSNNPTSSTAAADAEANSLFAAGANSRDRFWRARRNTLKTLVTVCVVYVLCWCLNNALYVGFSFGRRLNFSSPLYNVSVILVFVNCCVNPVIYVVDNRNFRVALVDLVCRCFERAQQQFGAKSFHSQQVNSSHWRRHSSIRDDVTGQARVALSLVGDRDVSEKLFNSRYEVTVL